MGVGLRAGHEGLRVCVHQTGGGARVDSRGRTE